MSVINAVRRNLLNYFDSLLLVAKQDYAFSASIQLGSSFVCLLISRTKFAHLNLKLNTGLSLSHLCSGLTGNYIAERQVVKNDRKTVKSDAYFTCFARSFVSLKITFRRS